MQVGQRHAEAVNEQVQHWEEALPSRSRRTCAAIVLRLESLGSRADRAVHIATTIFYLWAYVANRGGRRRVCIARLPRTSLHAALQQGFLVRCLILWRSLLSRTEAALVAEGEYGQKRLKECRRRGAALIWAGWDAAETSSICAAVLCWHLLTLHSRLQRTLEHIFAEESSVTDEMKQRKEDIESLRRGWDDERVQLQDENWILTQRLHHLDEECDRNRGLFHEAFEEQKRLEENHQAQSACVRSLSDELASAIAQAARCTEEAVVVRRHEEAAMAEARGQDEVYIEEHAAMQIGLSKLQQEATRVRERRQRDGRDARQQMRAQMARQEAATQRLSQAQLDDRDAWNAKIRQSEARVAKLADEVQNLRQSMRELPLRAEELEEEGARLREQVAAAEAELQGAEAAEQSRLMQLRTLRGAHESLTARCEALERECASL